MKILKRKEFSCKWNSYNRILRDYKYPMYSKILREVDEFIRYYFQIKQEILRVKFLYFFS